jgi:hypothetical protein
VEIGLVLLSSLILANLIAQVLLKTITVASTTRAVHRLFLMNNHRWRKPKARWRLRPFVSAVLVIAPLA